MLNDLSLRTKIDAVIVVAAAIVVLTLGLLVKNEQARLDQAAEHSFDDIHVNLHTIFSSLEAQILGIAATASEFRGDFPTSVHRLVAQTGSIPALPNWDGIAYAPEIQVNEAAQLTSWVEGRQAEFQRLGYSDFEIFPQPPINATRSLFPVLLVLPASSRQRVFGFDFASEPRRRDALRHAFEAAGLHVTLPISSTGMGPQENERILAVVATHTYDWLASTQGGQQRRGVILASLDFKALLQSSFPPSRATAQRLEVRTSRTLKTVPICEPDCNQISEAGLLTYQTIPKTLDARLGDLDFTATYTEQVLYPSSLFVYGATSTAATILISFLMALYLVNRQSHRATNLALREQQKDVAQKDHLIASRAQLNSYFYRVINAVLHELNNTLGVGLGHIEAARREPGLKSELRGHLLKIEEVLEHTRALGKRLDLFEPVHHPSKAPIQLHGFLSEIMTGVRQVSDINLVLEASAGTKDSAVNVDDLELRLALMNLVFNAIRAVERQGPNHTSEVIIWSRVKGDPLPPNVVGIGDPPLRLFVQIGVSDNGVGMNEHQLKRARELGYTTKVNPSDGDGFGLFSVDKFVSGNGGVLEIWSELEVGTTVAITLPLDTPDMKGARDEDIH